MPITDYSEHSDTEDEMSLKELKDNDKKFLESMQYKTEDSTYQESNDAFTFWFLIILLLLFIFFLVMAAVMIVKGRRRRYYYRSVGYMV